MNKNFVLILVILNLIGVITSFITYLSRFSYYPIYLWVFIPISFILYLSMFLFWVFVYIKKKIPDFLLIFTFYVNFVYGIGSFIFYPLFMIFILGFNYYHFWNIFAHGFLGLQSILIFKYLRKVRLFWYFLLIFIIILKDVSDLYFDTFGYFVDYEFGNLKFIIIGMVFILQALGLFVLFNYQKF